MKNRAIDTKTIVAVGLLTAMEIVLSRFCSFAVWNMKIGFAFVPVAAAAVLYGPLAGGAVGALGDFVGAILFPIGAYFPGFTVTAFLMGVTWGLFLHKKQTARRILGAVAVNQLVLSFLLNTLWISVLYGTPYPALLTARAVQTAVLGPVQFATLDVLARTLGRYVKKAAA